MGPIPSRKGSLADEESLRHYIVNAVIPTCIEDMAEILSATGGAMYFSQLPFLGSRGVLAGFYSVMGDALRATNIKKAHAWMEAALSFPMRMRLNPAQTQIGLDSITYTEDLHAVGLCHSPAFFDYALKDVSVFPDIPAFGGLDKKAIGDQYKKLGVHFRGKPLGEAGIPALMLVAPFASEAKVWQAFKDFEQTSSGLNDQSKIAGICGVFGKHFPKGSVAFDAFVDVFLVLRAPSRLTRA